MALDDGSADREADARALGRYKGLEQLRDDAFADSGAGILDGDGHVILRVGRGSDDQRLLTAVDHRIDRISYEVGQYLLDLDTVDEHEIRVGIELVLALDSMFARADQRQGIGLGD